MSKEKAPYFFKSDSDSYHWELGCKFNNYKSSNKEWNISNRPPENKQACKNCLAQKEKTKQFWDRQPKIKEKR